jgi:raffinose/stachyose/melibiose transport system permease protein
VTRAAVDRAAADRAGRWRRYGLSGASVVVLGAVFVVPFAFVVLSAVKTRQEASLLALSWPGQWRIVQNFVEVVSARNYLLIIAFINSVILTVASVTISVVLAAMAAFVLQRRPNRWTPLVNLLVLSGLIIPPAVVPTIWVLDGIGLFRTMAGLIMVEVAFGLSFCVLLFRAFLVTVPRELDEAAVLDGAGPLRLFFRVIFPLLRPVIVTVVVVQSVTIYNDFVNPLYFLPGEQNATVQLTLFNFNGQYSNQYNLLFMDILLIMIPPLVMFVFFSRQIVAGLTSGAVKG